MSHQPKPGNAKHQRGGNEGGDSSPVEKCLFVRPQVQAVRIEASSEDKERHSDEKRYWDKQIRLASNLNRITAVGAAISVFTLVALFFSLRYTREATGAAISQSQTSQREFESSQRPWVSLDVSGAQMVVYRAGAGEITVYYRLNNMGHSVATNVMFKGYVVPVQEETGKECEVSQEWLDTLKSKQGGTIIFPTQTAAGAWPAVIRIHFQPNMGLRFVGCLFYASPVDKSPHVTQLEYWIQKRGGGFIYPPPEGGSFDIDLKQDINRTQAN